MNAATPACRRDFLKTLSISAGALAAQTTGLPTDRVFDVARYGAVANDGGDDSAAFQSALEALAAEGGGVLHIPPGDWHFARRVSAAIHGGTVVIRGSGQGASRLVGNNPEGILSLRDDKCLWQVAIRDLSFAAARPAAGVAVETTSPRRGVRNYRTLTIRDVDIRGDGLPTRNYFTTGIDATDQWRPLFENVIVSGAYDPKLAARRDDASPLYGMTCAFIADGCYAPTFEHCYAWSAGTGYRIVTDGRPEGPEDGAFRRCTANGVRVGIDVRTQISEPQMVIDACHINARDVGIRLEKRKFFWITDCLMYGHDAPDVAAPYVDIDLIECHRGIVDGNIFHSPHPANIHKDPPFERIMIRIDGGSRHVVVSDNMFNAKGVAVAVDPAARNVEILDNSVTNPHTQTRDGSGTR